MLSGMTLVLSRARPTGLCEALKTLALPNDNHGCKFIPAAALPPGVPDVEVGRLSPHAPRDGRSRAVE
jgi:hypothetical protein